MIHRRGYFSRPSFPSNICIHNSRYSRARLLRGDQQTDSPRKFSNRAAAKCGNGQATMPFSMTRWEVALLCNPRRLGQISPRET